MTTEWDDQDDAWEEVTHAGDTPTPVGGTETQAVVNDRYDVADWQDALTQPDLHALHQSVDVAYDTGSELLKDLFWLFTKGDPQVRDVGEMAAEHIPHRQLVEQFRQYPEFANLRAHTVANPFNAVTALLSMDTEIRAALDAMQAAQDQAKELAQAEAQGADTDALRASVEAAGKAAAVAASGQLVAGADKSETEITEDAELMHGFGVGDGEQQQMSYAERKALTRRLKSNRLAKFAKLIGAFKAEVQGQERKQADSEPSEITGVKLGDDLNRLTSGELVNLAVPELDLLFFQRYVERALLVYEVTGNQRQGRGPLVLCVDESGSMLEELGGVTREAWSKALSLALVELARRQNRGVIYIGWSTGNSGQPIQHVIDLSKPDVEATIRMTEHFYDGGTHFETPLMSAKRIAVEHFDIHREGRADIVFITDDAYDAKKLDPFWVKEFRDECERASVAVHGILIGSEQSGAMAAVCDTVRPITGVIAGNEIEPVAGMFQELMKP